MFIATMYSYGRDADCVGVNGIMTCMGIFLVTRTQLYAIHIPAVGPASEGVYAFVRYVRLEYNVHDDVVWQHGGTTTRTGFYRNGSCNEVLRTNLAAAGWTSINATNSTIEEPSGWWGYCSML